MYLFYNWTNKLQSEENKVPTYCRKLFCLFSHEKQREFAYLVSHNLHSAPLIFELNLVFEVIDIFGELVVVVFHLQLIIFVDIWV